MPKIDPITGCEVMTQAEFWDKVGAAEGKTGAEAMDEFLKDMEKERLREERELANPMILRQVLNDRITEENAYQLRWYKKERARGYAYGPCLLPEVSEVLEVFEAKYDFDLSSSRGSARARVRYRPIRRKNHRWRLGAKKEGIVSIRFGAHSGNFYEPPSEDLCIEFEGTRWIIET